MVRACEPWLGEHFRDGGVVQRVVDYVGVPERTLNRRFKAATGNTLRDYVQNLRIEKTERLPEGGRTAVDEISATVG